MGVPDDPAQPPAAALANHGGGLSTNAWAAIAALGAAVITGSVTLVTHFLPSTESTAPTNAAIRSSTLPATSVSSATGAVGVVRSDLLVRLTGSWTGQASDSSGTYRITLVIADTCAEGQPCGTMTTSLLPCIGNIRLVRIRDGNQFDFGVDSFRTGSSTACRPRLGGDYFALSADDTLFYTAGYSSDVNGTLLRFS